MTTTNNQQWASRVTSHQAEVLTRIVKHCNRVGRALASDIGCEGAVNRLWAKGYVDVTEYARGPRGGSKQQITLTEKGRAWGDARVLAFQPTVR